MEDDRNIWIGFSIENPIISCRVVPMHVMEIYGGIEV
jgi:hypothetical protein